MELKPYQQEVIDDLNSFLDCITEYKKYNLAYYQYWLKRNIDIRLGSHSFLKPYNDIIPGVPRVTIKVPTAGGKTFIACNAVKPIFDHTGLEKPKVLLWFVPSDSILKQTLKNLSDSTHPYRVRINTHFNNRVEIYDKEKLLSGHSFDPISIQGQLSIMVLSVQSFAANNKDGRRVYRENENLAMFPQYIEQSPNNIIENADETSLIQTLANLNPVIIIDESHNFSADLRIDMLKSLRPRFILDLTATPRKDSNIISFVDAMKLKKNNMVKLPVIVYNHYDINEVISSSIQLQRKLEIFAKAEQEAGGKYIRPIVLFQAQPKQEDENFTFEKIKNQLIDIGIPSEQIKIKTANLDEIKNIDLLSKNCPVRYIITVNALKEGWDCPFAYILSSLANKSSAVDVEQILGRVLRLPNVRKNSNELLNMSYVFTSSNYFMNTLEKIVEALNKAGFSKRDYRAADFNSMERQEIVSGGLEQAIPNNLFDTLNYNSLLETDIPKLLTQGEIPEINAERINLEDSQKIDELEAIAIETNSAYNEIINRIDAEFENNLEIGVEEIKSYKIRDIYQQSAKNITLPNFFMRVNIGSIFEQEGAFIPVSKNLLLDEFSLEKEDHKIDFNLSSSDIYKVDLAEKESDEFEPEYLKIDTGKENFMRYILSLPEETRINQLAIKLQILIGRMNEIPELEITNYIKSALDGLSSESISIIISNELSSAALIKKKINSLIENYSEKKFFQELDKGTIYYEPAFTFRENISPKKTTSGITKSLYSAEGEMNDFEKKVINEIANLETVEFWHRNLERGKGFCITGFINHYPDFIIKMKNGKIVLLETKGEQLANIDSQKKIKLGRKWADKAGDIYRYFMIFDKEPLPEAYSLSEILNLLQGMR